MRTTWKMRRDTALPTETHAVLVAFVVLSLLCTTGLVLNLFR